ncbi:DHS-like NAD/FAD-binding domain containing protein [Amanita muscaria]
MTLLVPLEPSTLSTLGPSFLRHSKSPDTDLEAVVKAIIKAKRIVVICGAGISVQAGIPAFRSPEGLFKSVKGDNLVSGKDLFDASVFTSEHSTSLFCQMIAQLSELSKAAEPTTFHRLLRTLDDSGKLLRVYTQNIDSIERKCGLSFGIPAFKDRYKGKYRLNSKLSSAQILPRCVPLHGTLELVHCQLCNHSFPLEDHLSSLTQGLPPQCPECTMSDQCRELAGKRPRGVGRLRPSVVLYNEVHRDGEDVGEIIREDSTGSSTGKGRSGADLLLVVGTSLRVLGTKRMVREFAKAVHGRRPSSCPSPADPSAIKTVYLNLEFPVPARDWNGVFDVWLRGDAQEFAVLLDQEIRRRLCLTQRKRRAKEGSSYDEQSQAREKECQHTPDLSPTKLYIRIPARQRNSFPIADTASITNTHSEGNLNDPWTVVTECIA